MGVNRMIEADKLNFEKSSVSDFITSEKILKLENMIAALNYNAFGNWLEEIFENFRKTKGIDPVVIYKSCEKIFDIVTNSLISVGVKPEEAAAFRNQLTELIENARSLKELQDLIYRFIVNLLETLMNEKHMQQIRPIRLAMDYISQNYAKTLGLEEVSEKVFLNPAYFSTIFKKETGLNFIDYLINCRLEAAREMLKNSSAPISEIAEKVGYTDTKYFSKLFSKVVGIKPSEYRKLYS